jgi:hypothetical protein
LGCVIVSLQTTQHDASSTLRMFAKIDTVMQLLAVELGLPLTELRAQFLRDEPYVARIPVANRLAGHKGIYLIPYGSDGNRLPEGALLRQLDLSAGAQVKLANGPFAGDVGQVEQTTRYGFQLHVTHPERPGWRQYEGSRRTILGSWLLDAAVRGALDSFPLATAKAR